MHELALDLAHMNVSTETATELVPEPVVMNATKFAKYRRGGKGIAIATTAIAYVSPHNYHHLPVDATRRNCCSYYYYYAIAASMQVDDACTGRVSSRLSIDVALVEPSSLRQLQLRQGHVNARESFEPVVAC